MSAQIVKTMFLLILFVVPVIVTAQDTPDFDREKRLADEIVDSIVIGDAIELNDGKRNFLGIMTEAESDKPKGAVLILHGRGYHPAWPTVVQPLRTALPEDGWATLSIQMPVLVKDAKYFDYVPLFGDAHDRIKSALKYLSDEGYQRVVLLAHSCGAHMAMSYFRKHTDKGLAAYIGIGSGATDYKQKMVEPFPFAEMKVPVLDIYGSNDFPAVLRMAGERKALITQAGHSKSKQAIVDGADHYYKKSGTVEKLTEKIIVWLNSL